MLGRDKDLIFSWLQFLQTKLSTLPKIPERIMLRVVRSLMTDFFESEPRKTNPLKDAKMRDYKHSSFYSNLEDLFMLYVMLNIKDITGLSWIEFSNLSKPESDMIIHNLRLDSTK